jgi:hypothetical protein
MIPRAIDSALTQCILRRCGFGGFAQGGVPQITNPAIKRIPHITHLIANLLFIFFGSGCLRSAVMLIFVFCLYRDGNF